MTETIKGKIVIRGKVENVSPIHIGCGSDERTDMDILLDANGKPFIPATALTGVLRHTISTGDEKAENRFWGFTEKDEGRQSAFRCSDMTSLSESPIVIRDGIKIDNRTGMVKYQGKYDFEILEREASFCLNICLTFAKGEDEEFVKRMAATIFDLLKKGNIGLGAKTNNGLGKIRLVKNKTSIHLFDFSNKRDVFQWLTGKYHTENAIPAESLGKPFDTGVKNLRMDVTLAPQNALIIRSYPGDPEMPDAVHIKSKDDCVLTGSSLKGAIRARAERIANTIGKPSDFLDGLFGFVEKKKSGKGKVRVRETILPHYEAELQNRIKIDRFTGGTVEGALFDSMPLFFNDDDKVCKVVIDVRDCTEKEAGLMLLVLKDLWTGDLAVGGEKSVGRGIFKGVKAFIEWKGGKYVIDRGFGNLPAETRNTLQQLVTALNSEN